MKPVDQEVEVGLMVVVDRKTRGRVARLITNKRSTRQGIFRDYLRIIVLLLASNKIQYRSEVYKSMLRQEPEVQYVLPPYAASGSTKPNAQRADLFAQWRARVAAPM